MTDTYSIYLVNQSATTQTFWCFLASPLPFGNPMVFANSSAALTVAPNDPGTNVIAIPAQYAVAAGASNNAVGLNVIINSDVSENAALASAWLADYANAPPNMGPSLLCTSGSVPANGISLSANDFNKNQNENMGWFSNMSFGINTSAGFMGITWSPDPGQQLTLTPALRFYVTTGMFTANALADWVQIESQAATIEAPANFSNGACTATYTAWGQWEVVPGAPA